jgi:HlyD family secretion protein
MKKLVVVVVVLLIAGYVGYRQWPAWRAALPAGNTSPERPKTAVVIQTNINFAVNAAGEIGPAEQVSVRPEINGRIEQLPVDVGDSVRKGDLLFALDDKELQQQKASQLTGIERAQLELEQAERNYRRSEELFAENLISKELYENAKTAFELAKNSLQRAQREQALIEERLTQTKVVAPFDCTVLTRPVSIGQAVSGSGGFNSGTEVLTIADLNSMVINAHINQADVPRLQVNQLVEVAVEAVTGLKVTGVVERIAPQATIKNNIKGFAARILLKNVDQRVRPGMTANIKIPVASAENVLAVPLAAVFTEKDPESGQYERFVYVERGGTLEKRLVKVGVADYFFAEVQEGLAPGETVALELPKEIRDKQPPGGLLAGSRPGQQGGGLPLFRAATAPPAATNVTTPPVTPPGPSTPVATPTAAPAPAAARPAAGGTR